MIVVFYCVPNFIILITKAHHYPLPFFNHPYAMKYGYQYMYYSIHTVVKRDLDGPFIMLRLTLYMYYVNSVHSLNHPLVLSFTQCSGFMMTLKGVPSTYNKDLQASLYVHLHFRNV